MRTKIPEIQKLRMNPEEGDYLDNVTLGSENPVAEEIANDLLDLPLQFIARDASMPVCDEDEESPENHEEEEPMILSVSSAQEIRDRELHGCSNLNTEHVELLSHADEPNEPSTSGQNVEQLREYPSYVQSTPIEFETASSSAPQHPIMFGQEAECDYSLSPVSDDGKYKVWEETDEHEEMNNSVSAEQACGFIDEQQSMQEELPDEHAATADTSDEGNNAKVPPEGEDARFSCVLCSAWFALEADVVSHVRSHDISMFYRRVKRQDGMIVESEDVYQENHVDQVGHDHCDSGKEGQEGNVDVSHSELAQQPANDAHECQQCDRRYGTKRGLDLHVIFTHKGKRKSTEVEMLRSSLQKYAAATVNLPERRRTVKESSGSDKAVKRPPNTVGGNSSATRQVGSAPSYVCLHCLHVVSFEGRNVKSRYSAYQKMWKHVVSVHAKKTARTNVDFVTGLGAGNVPSSGRVLKAAAPTGNIMCQKCGKGFQTERARAIHAARNHRRKLLPYSNRKGKSDQQNVFRKTKKLCTRILSGKRKHSANATPKTSKAANICGAVFSCLYCVYEYRCILTKRECAEKHDNVIKGLWHSNAYQMIGYHVRKEHKKPCIQNVAYKLKSKEIQVTTPSSDIRASPRVSQHTQSPRKKAKTSPTEQPEIVVNDSVLQQQQCGIVYSCAHCTSFHATCELTKEDCVYRYYTRTGATQTKRHRFAEPRTRRHLLSKHDNITSFKLGIDYTRSDASESAFTIHGPTVVSCLHCSEFIRECDGSLQHKKAIVAMHGHVRKKHSGTVVKRGVDYKVDTTATPAEKSITLKRKHPATVPSIVAKKKDNLVLSKTPRVADPDQPCCSTQPSTSSPAKTKTASCVPVPATPTSSATATATTTSISFACTRCPYITSMYMDIRGHCAKEHPDAVAGRMIQNVLDYTKIFS